jgi:colanic acid biosynthesis protein WcaH
MLKLRDFKQVVKHAPLFAIDLVIVNKENQVLLGKRINKPAQGFWFVPGGRVLKDESLEAAFKRISKTELGVEVERNTTKFLGMYEHFYKDSFFGEGVSTHYINATHVVKLVSEQLYLSKEQHSDYRWVAMGELANDKGVHDFSKVFLPELTNWIAGR